MVLPPPLRLVIRKLLYCRNIVLRRERVMKWFVKDSPSEDRVVAEANAYILKTLSDADTVGQIEAGTERNVRDQLTVEQAEELYQEERLRNFGHKRN